MDLPVEHFLRALEGHPDTFAFTAGGKALTEDSVEVAENGDLIIKGYAAVWEGDDRQGENFAPGAFKRAAKAFLEAGGPLCFHHRQDHVLGQVTKLEEDQKGLAFEARVDGETAKHPVLGTIYGQIKKGTLKGVSVGGFFKRAIIAGKQKIADMDFAEISVTGVPMHTGPSFAVVAGKALSDTVELGRGDAKSDDVRAEIMQAEDVIREAIEKLDAVFSDIIKKTSESDEDEEDGENSESGEENTAAEAPESDSAT